MDGTGTGIGSGDDDGVAAICQAADRKIVPAAGLALVLVLIAVVAA